MSNDPKDIIRLTIKFISSEHIDSFVNNGELYMNPLSYFKDLEDNCNSLRSDVHEGLAATYDPAKIIFKFGNHTLNGLTNKVDLWLDNLSNINILSLTSISDYDMLVSNCKMSLSKKFIGFGDKAIVFPGYKITDLFNRMKLAIKKDKNIIPIEGQTIYGQKVDYVSRLKYHGEMGPFRKFDNYSWQMEWRLAVKHAKQYNLPYKLHLGNISDICDIYETKDLINMPIELVKICQ
jgi:hypothetical protein